MTILIAVSQSAFLVIYAVIDENNPKADDIRHFDYSELINKLGATNQNSYQSGNWPSLTKGRNREEVKIILERQQW